MDQRRRQLRGRMGAVSEYDLDQRLRDRALDLIACAPVKGYWGAGLFSSGVRTRDLIQLCVHLEQLHAAGVPLLEALADVRDSIDSPLLRDAMSEVERDVSEGVPLSTAFGVHSNVFDSVFTSLIAAGEETGNLTDMFRHLVKHLKWTEAMAAKVKKATRYPAILAVVMVLATLFLMLFVVPQVVDLLKLMGKELPFPTRALVAFSAAVEAYWYMVMLIPAALYGQGWVARRVSRDFAVKVDFYLLRLPVIGSLIRKISFARFAHMFAVTFESGIALLTCLETAQRVITNRNLVQAVDVVKERVQTGEPLSVAMRVTGEFPAMVVRMVKVGEESGNLAHTLWIVAELYDRDVDDSVQAMIAMIEPALMVVMGGMMAWIAIAVFGPVYGGLGELL